MAKPSQLPQWATNPGKTFEPDSTRKANGHEIGSRPPARVQNWWQNLVYQWVQYLDSGNFEGRITATQGFEAGADEHITVVDGGKFLHGAAIRELEIRNTGGKGVSGAYSSAGLLNAAPLLQSGDRLLTVSLTVNTLNAGNTLAFSIYRDGALVATSNTTPNAVGTVTIFCTPAAQSAYNGTGSGYVIYFFAPLGSIASNFTLQDFKLIYDRP